MTMTTTQQDAAVERMAYRMAYAPLRSAQHAFDLIHRQTGDRLAKEESKRIGHAIAALSATPAVRDDSGEVARLREALEPFARAHGTVAALDAFDPRWPDHWTLDGEDVCGFAESVTVGDLRRARAALEPRKGE
jgi:hypothetical protein